MLSMIHDVTIVNTGRRDRKTNMEIKKPYTVVQYNKFIEGLRQGRPVPQLLHSSKENCKVYKKGGIVSIKLCTFRVQDIKYKQKSKVQELPA